MWKKFIAVMALIGLLSSSSAMAVDTVPVDGDDYINDLYVTPNTIDASSGETAEVSFELLQEAEVYSYVVNTDPNSDDYMDIVTTFQNYEPSHPGNINYTWYGTVANNPHGDVLDDGPYSVKVFTQVNGSIVDSAVFDVEIDSDTAPPVPGPSAPEVTGLKVSPSSFDPKNGEVTTIEFDIDKDADVAVAIKDGNTFIRSYSDYNGDSYDGPASFEIEWNGKNNGGSIVSDGFYTVVASARNSGGIDTDTKIVQVETNEQVKYPEIYNLRVSPEEFSAKDGEYTKIAFELDEDAYIDVVVKNSRGQLISEFEKYDGSFFDQPDNYYIKWDGTYNNGTSNDGEIVRDGTYVVYVSTKNSAGVDMESVKVRVETDDVVVDPDSPEVSNLDVEPNSFDPGEGETTEITFDVDQNAYLTVKVLKDTPPGVIMTVRSYQSYDGNDWYYSTADHSVIWDGRYDNGNFVTEGAYQVSVKAENSNGSDTDSYTVYVNYDGDGPSSNEVIENVQLNPSTLWDPTDDELEIEFELNEEVDELLVEAKKGSKTIEILEEDDADDDDYEEIWDGTDDDGDYIDDGIWEIIITADGNVVKKSIKVEYEKPEIVDAFVTKDSFDPDEDEVTNLVFKVDEDALVTVEVYDGSDRIETLIDEDEISKNKWYAVEWDGYDDDGDEVSEDEYTFKITAENLVDDDINDVEYVDVEVEEDYVSSGKANVTEDYTEPIVFDEEDDDTMTISYCLDDDAEVYLAIYEGKSASGSTEVVLLDYYEQNEGCHSVTWEVEDEDGDELRDDIYSYKIIAKVDSKKEKETGRFVVGNAGGDDDDDDDDYDYDDIDVDGACYSYYSDLGYLNVDNELCEAIAWSTEEGIFHGYPDGTFKPYQNINRAEVLKVVLEAFDVSLLPTDGSTQGFSDVQPYAWYMPYVRTAKFYSMLHGYPDGTARLENNINRVELLKFVLEASERFTSYEFINIPYYNEYADVNESDPNVQWFYDYANAAYKYGLYNTYVIDGVNYLKPAQLVERGEVALLLYRMKKAEMLD